MVATAAARAIGTGVQVVVTEPYALDAAMATVLEYLEELDLAASRFRDDSDIARVNEAEGAAVRVGPLCVRAVQASLRVAADTGGIVDPTVGADVERAGYDRDFALVRAGTGAGARADTTTAREAATWEDVECDALRHTVRVPAGVHLDLGSSAKALAADDCAADAALRLGCGVLVNLGGDIAVAGPAPDGGWTVRVTDDHAAPPDAPGQTIAIREGGLATSSTTVRTWEADGAAAHHIIDPRSGRPAAVVWRTVSATARTCVDANAAATAAIVLGDAAIGWLEARRIPARLVDGAGTVRHLCGWPEAGEQQ